MYRFENLQIWKLSVDYCDQVFQYAQSFPDEIKFNLGEQLRRAALSISNNIAEGSGSDSKADFKKFLNYSVRSTFEVASMMHVLKKRGLIDQESFDLLYNECLILTKKISAFKKSL